MDYTKRMEIGQRIERRARALGYDGDPWPDFLPKPKTLHCIASIQEVLASVPLFQLSTQDQRFAEERAAAVVLTSSGFRRAYEALDATSEESAESVLNRRRRA